jgi:uncharacterized surface protein with fasciclin (FAS1) repeats
MKRLIIFITSLFFSFNSIADTHEITAQNYSYTPQNITINVGDTIIWINNGGFHNVNGDINTLNGESFNNPESFSSNPNNELGELYTHVFNIEGEYSYDCSVGSHAELGMTGTINVQAPLPSSVFEIIEESTDHDTLEIAIVSAELAATLSGEGTFTVFAPTDDAFAILDSSMLQDVLASTNLLSQVLLHHVHNEASVLSSQLFDGMLVPTLNNQNLTITETGNSTFKVEYANIIVTDIVAENGVVHVIDAVLIPEFEDITVVDIIVNSPMHNKLESALIAANLITTLSGDGPFTVFAPTDDAFDNLPAGALDALLEDNDALTALLTHHVHGGELLSENISDGLSISTLNNDNLSASNNGTTIMIDNAVVTTADISDAENGVVHIIDAVLVLEEPTDIDNLFIKEKATYMYTINLLGEIVERDTDEKILIDIFSNGKTVKRINTTK